MKLGICVKQCPDCAGEEDNGQKVICWGADFAGQSTVPKDLADGLGNKHIVGISVGWEHSCAASLEVSHVCTCVFLCCVPKARGYLGRVLGLIVVDVQGNRVFCWGGKQRKHGLDQQLVEPGCIGMCTGITCSVCLSCFLASVSYFGFPKISFHNRMQHHDRFKTLVVDVLR